MTGDWRDSALCARVDPTLWFPDSYLYLAQVRAAKRVCRVCPSLLPCQEWALTETRAGQLVDGIAGGLTPKERRRLVRSGWVADRQREAG